MKDINVCKMEYITGDEICEAMNVDSIYTDFTFITDCNGDFHFLSTSDSYLEELYEEVRWHTNKFEANYVRQLKNEIKLVEYLRSKGYKNGMHIFY